MNARHVDPDPLLVRGQPPEDRHRAQHEAQREDVGGQRLQHDGQEPEQDARVHVGELVDGVHRDPRQRDEEQRGDGEDERDEELPEDVGVELQGLVPGCPRTACAEPGRRSVAGRAPEFPRDHGSTGPVP